MPVVIDVETAAIENRPAYPPKPVGVAFKFPGKKSIYYGFAHPDSATPENFGKAKELLTKLWNGNDQLLFWNAKFDLEVIEKFFGLPLPHWNRIEDGLFAAYLMDPHAPSLALKPTAERLLGEAPSEQDAVRDWLISQKIVTRASKKWGAHISQAPEKLVAAYACADVDKTAALFKLLYPQVKAAKMIEPYQREKELMPILLRNEQQGIRCDVERLGHDIEIYTAALEKVERWIRKYLKAPGLNLDADRDVAAALEGHVTEWTLTETGQKSVSKANLKPQHFNDPKLAAAIGYRTRLMTCMNTFMIPYAETAAKTGGVIHTNWNQTRGDRGGTRTGRLSSTPNFQNLPKSFDDKNDGYVHPAFLKVPPLPTVRKYILPDEGCVILHRDYASQELRILAHYEDGALLKAYQENVDLDPHNFIRGEVLRLLELNLQRRPVKVTVFTDIYGGGVPKLAEQLGTTVEEAATVRGAIRTAIPDVQTLARELRSCWRRGEPIRTWGGRLYHCEPPSNGRTFEYKALNIEVQGSAADISKQSIINYHNAKEHGRFLLTCHDENNVSAPIEHAYTEMAILKEAMEKIPLDAFLKTDGRKGTNWGTLEPYEELKGPDIRAINCAA